MKPFVSGRLLAAGLAAALLGGCGYGPDSQAGTPTLANPAGAPAPAVPLAPAVYTVTYLVAGEASAADVTISDGLGGTIQQAVNLPWVWRAQMPRGASLYVAAQSRDVAQTIRVEIAVGEALMRVTESAGDYVIATASMTCC